jgi:hypothetical protein
MQCGVVCLLYGCVTLVLPMSFFSSSQVVLLFVMCDSASLHILFYYCLRLRCRHVARARVPALPSLLASRHLRHRLITLKISPSSYHWPCRHNSSLLCRYSWQRPTTLSTPTPAVHCHDHKVCGDNVFHCSMVHGCPCVPLSHLSYLVLADSSCVCCAIQLPLTFLLFLLLFTAMMPASCLVPLVFLPRRTSRLSAFASLLLYISLCLPQCHLPCHKLKLFVTMFFLLLQVLINTPIYTGTNGRL